MARDWRVSSSQSFCVVYACFETKEYLESLINKSIGSSIDRSDAILNDITNLVMGFPFVVQFSPNSISFRSSIKQ